jgi:thiol-disulfide isomerase/thioredoxin
MTLNRRTATLAGVAAAITGLGLGWWHHRQSEEAAAAPADAPPATEPDLWSLSFDTPSGQALPLKSLRGKPLLLNFWATWCPPCVQEMPLLDAFHRQHRAAGWQVLGLAIDSPTPVKAFLAKQPVGFPIGLAGLTGVEVSRGLGNAHGGLPFTAVFDPRGEVLARHLGSVTQADLDGWVKKIAAG